MSQAKNNVIGFICDDSCHYALEMPEAKAFVAIKAGHILSGYYVTKNKFW